MKFLIAAIGDSFFSGKGNILNRVAISNIPPSRSLDICRMDDGMQHQSGRVDKHMAFLAF